MKIRLLVNKVRKLGIKLGFLKFIGYEAVFSCAFSIREMGKELYVKDNTEKKGFILLNASDEYWYADPLICKYADEEVVFLERVNRKTGLGCIAYSKIENGNWSEVIPVIEEPFHMSFPMCFLWGGELYMIPETEMSESIILYRCTSFPDKWEKVTEGLSGYRLVDSVVESIEDDRIVLIASEYDREDDFYTRFHRYEVVHNDGCYAINYLNRINDNFKLNGRMAGYPINNLFPIQRSTSGVYGYSVQFADGNPTSGNIIAEIEPKDIAVKGKKLIGVHTYCCSDEYEIIDVQYLVKKIK